METQLGFFEEPDCDVPITARHASFTDAFRAKILLKEVRKFGEVFDRSSFNSEDVICRYPVGASSYLGTRCVLIDRYHGDEDFIVMLFVKPRLEVARTIASVFSELMDDEIRFEILVDGGGVANIYATCKTSTRRELIAVVAGETVPVPKQSLVASTEAA